MENEERNYEGTCPKCGALTDCHMTINGTFYKVKTISHEGDLTQTLREIRRAAFQNTHCGISGEEARNLLAYIQGLEIKSKD